MEIVSDHMKVISDLLLRDDSVDDDEYLALSAFIFAVSLFLVSENCVAITTRHRLIMKNDPICKYQGLFKYYVIIRY